MNLPCNLNFPKISQLSQLAANYLKNYRLEKGVFIDAINDPNQTALIGQEYTLVTTDRGYIEAKLSSTNPNFAAFSPSTANNSPLAIILGIKISCNISHV